MSTAIATLLVLISLLGVVHALLNTREPRAAVGWIAVCISLPLFGPLIYLLFGINRLNVSAPMSWASPSKLSDETEANRYAHSLDRLTAKLSRYPCTQDNEVRMLRNGEQAYPEMLEAINNAEHFVFLSTYIFDSDETGKQFVAALSACVNRGVPVRVLIDSIGSLYSFPSAVRLLRKAGVPTSRFLPIMHRHSWLLNMRNHRKILAVDGRIAFVGGMNIGNRHLVGRQSSGAAADVQFRIQGSATRSLTDMFCRDWEFATGESVTLPETTTKGSGHTACRPVSDGPDSELGTLPQLLLGLIGSAKESITIVTPYFLPPPSIADALIGAALRGVHVRILLPEKNNLSYIKWASEHAMGNILFSSIEVYYQPRPFSHTKMLLIDDDFMQIGSYNMDARSLRLNFELAVNIYDQALRREVDAQLSETVTGSRQIDNQYLSKRSMPARIRDAVVWLFMPYL